MNILEDIATTLAASLAWIDSASFIFLMAGLMGAGITLGTVWVYRQRNMPSWYKQGSLTLLKAAASLVVLGVFLSVLYFGFGGGSFNALAAASAAATLIIYTALCAGIVALIESAGGRRNRPAGE